MWVSKVRIQNYSSFVDSGWVELSRGMNVVVGQNNSGKTSFLEAISAALPNKPHRDPDQYLPGSLKAPEVHIDISSSTAEFRRRLTETSISVQAVVNRNSQDNVDRLREWILQDSELILESKLMGGQEITARRSTFHDKVGTDAGAMMKLRMRGGNLVISSVGAGSDDTMVKAYASGDNGGFFSFIAQRLNVAKFPYGRQTKLRSDAANLPAVLAYLFGNRRPVFEEIERRVQEIIPSVAAITVSPEEDGNFEIVLWSERDARVRELAFSLSDSGTGIAQAISIITAVVTSDASVIVVDEINSFLHPSAVKKLLQICTSSYPQHQYIFSTHSADVMSYTSVDTLLLVEKVGFVSTVRQVARDNLQELRDALRHVGIGMMDVLGSDRIVWVEGPTEEVCFPRVMERAKKEIPEALTFTSVASTGDFSRRGSSKKAVIDLYDAATRAVAPLVAGTSFALDRETLPDEAVKAVEQQVGARLKLLPRRCLECYALSPEAIAETINSELEGTLHVTPEDVGGVIAQLAPDRRYGGVSKWKGDLTENEWLKRVDAAKLLKDAFEALTDHKLAYRKTVHTPRIIGLIPRAQIKELEDFVEAAVAAAMA